MYEDVTFENILERLLSRVPDSFDKREGSVIYDALAPFAFEYKIMLIELDTILKETFGTSASREFLIKRAMERGLTPYPASFAVLKGEFNIDVPIGSRFTLREVNYKVCEKISTGVFKLECEEIGSVGNKHFGDLVPIDYIKGLTSAKLTSLLIPAEDEEDTESFRSRYFASFDTKVYGGNVADYLEKTNSISGVSATKVTPVWKGGGTVLLHILDSEFNRASETLVSYVQEIIDPTKDGKGQGVAPIGHIVTVRSAIPVNVSINTSIVFKEGYSFSIVESEILSAIEDYFLEIRKGWANEENSYIRVAQIEAKILAINGVLDIGNTKINGKLENQILDKYSIPILEGVYND